MRETKWGKQILCAFLLKISYIIIIMSLAYSISRVNVLFIWSSCYILRFFYVFTSDNKSLSHLPCHLTHDINVCTRLSCEGVHGKDKHFKKRPCIIFFNNMTIKMLSAMTMKEWCACADSKNTHRSWWHRRSHHHDTSSVLHLQGRRQHDINLLCASNRPTTLPRFFWSALMLLSLARIKNLRGVFFYETKPLQWLSSRLWYG